MRQFLLRRWVALVRWWVNPASQTIEREPRIPGNQKKKQVYGEGRPIPIEIAFHLHRDGSVLKRSRKASGERRVDSLDVKQLVYDEYEELLRLARARHRRETILQRFHLRPKVREAE